MDLLDIKTQENLDNLKDWTKITYGNLNVFDEYMKICDEILDYSKQDDEMFEILWFIQL